MLKKGLAWHYKAYDQRPELDKVISLYLNYLSDCNRQFLELSRCICSGRERLEPSGLGYGHLQILRCHGSGERTGVKADNLTLRSKL